MKSLARKWFFFTTSNLLYFALAVPPQAQGQACTHYASPTGTGSGVSAAQPFKVANFWPLAKPGYTLCLLDGQYLGSTSMINPPQNLRGSATAAITIRALNDGKATINGQGSYLPVRLYYNDYFVLDGFNARSSAGNVISLSYSSHNILRRVAAWDAADRNTNIFAVNYGTNNLLEDVAGWGIARKIFSSSQGGNYTTIRRAWGRWEGSHVVGPKMTYTLAYNNTNMIVENSLGTWSGERMKQTYTLLAYDGTPWTGNGAGTYTNYSVEEPYGIFAVDALTGSDKNARTKLLGSIAYVLGTDRFAPPQAVLVTKLDSFEVAHTVAYIQPGTNATKKRFALYNLQTAVGLNLVATHLTGIGGAGSTFGSEWKKSFISEGSSLSAVANVFTSANGANLCYRYKDGALTTTPLWPWPMNQRIINALIESGRTPVDITQTIESLLGTIPPACKSTLTTAPSLSGTSSTGTSSGGTVPSIPANLQASP